MERQIATSSMKRTLVTGASGFIGSRLIELLIAKGIKVRGLSRSSSNLGTFDLGTEDIEFVNCDITDHGDLKGNLDNVEVVFHLAGVAHVGTNDQIHLQNVNIKGTSNLISACKSSGVRRLVFFSSALARQFDSCRVVDKRTSTYAWSKKQAEELLLESNSEDFKVSILRPTNVYGAGMKGNVAGMLQRIRLNNLPPLPKLENPLFLVGVDDLCRAAIMLSESDAAAGNIYPVSDGEVYTPNLLEEAIYAALGRKKPGWRTPRVVFYAASLGAQIANNLGIWNNDLGLRTYRNLIGRGEDGRAPIASESCEKIATELGFKPTQTFYDALPAIIESLE